VIILSNTLYLWLNDQYYITYLYVTFYYAVMITTTTAVFYSISKGIIATQRKLNPLLFLCLIIGMASVNLLVTLTMIFPEYKAIVFILGIVRVATGICYITVQGC
jgi:hypothetical protein